MRHDNIKTVAYDDRRDVLYIGTHTGGMSRYDGRTGRFFNYSGRQGEGPGNIIYSMLFHDGRLYVSARNGLWIFDPETDGFEQLLSYGPVLTFDIDSRGFMWMADRTGLLRMDLKGGGEPERVRTDSSDVSCRVTKIHESASGLVYIATLGQGVKVYDHETDSFKTLSRQVALDEFKSKWRANKDNKVNDWIESNTTYLPVNSTAANPTTEYIVGYNNTMAMNYYNLNGLEDAAADEVQAVTAIMEYRAENPIESGASGWYLPSIKELSLLFKGNISMWTESNAQVPVINESLAKISGAVSLTGDYWSSTETYPGDIQTVRATGKLQTQRSFNELNVRPVMAF